MQRNPGLCQHNDAEVIRARYCAVRPGYAAAVSTNHRDRSSRRTLRGRPVLWTVGVTALLITCLLTWSLIDLLSGESAGDDVGITVEDVLEDTDQYLRESVTVRGRVREVGHGAFAIGDDEPDDQLLLLTTAHTRGSASAGQVREIVGTVRRFDQELLRALRVPFDASLGARFLKPYDGQPTVIVRSVTRPHDTND